MFKRVRDQIEKIFYLDNNTSRHSPPDMKKTFARLAIYLEKEAVNEFISGRKTNCLVENKITQGMGIMFGLNSDLNYAELWADLPDTELEATEEDLELDD